MLLCVRQAVHTPHCAFFLSCPLLKVVQARERAQGCEAIPVAPSKGGCNGQHQRCAPQTYNSSVGGAFRIDRSSATGAVLLTCLQCSPEGTGELSRHLPARDSARQLLPRPPDLLCTS